MIKKLDPDLLRAHKGISFVGVTTSFMCHDGNGNFFMTKRSKNCRDEQGRWDCGGGGLKWGVSAEANVRREIKEEYGVDVLKLESLGYDDVFRILDDGTPTHWVALRFVARVDRDKVTINEPEMADDGGWFTLETLPKPLHSQLQPFLAKYTKELDRILNSK